MDIRRTGVLLGLAAVLAASALAAEVPAKNLCGGAAAPGEARRVIVFVWDGLRPDSIDAGDTPNLLALGRRGVVFTDNHATYPTFTMMNAASIATGAFSDANGFYGNDVYRPGGTGRTSDGVPVDFTQPVFTEDYGVLDGLDASYGGRLLQVQTLFQAMQAHAAADGRPLRTVVVGKSGPAYLQDYKRGGMIVDERIVWPLALAKKLQAAGFPLPRRSPLAYGPHELELAPGNGDPTGVSRPVATLADGITPNPVDASGSANDDGNHYLMTVFTSYLLPQEKPDLSVIWLRSPDSTEHAYGVGSANARDALRAQDTLLGQLEQAVAKLGLASTTDLIVMSDHGHSNVAGPTLFFPPRQISYRDIGEVDDRAGFSVSGDVRLADLLTRAGFVAYDGGGCSYDPVLAGIKADGAPVYPAIPADEDGADCGCAWGRKRYTSGSHRVPRSPNALSPHALVVASNGGSDYVYALDHDADTVARVVRFLESREEIGPIFVAGRYGAIAGTLPLSAIRLENAEGRNPDIVTSYTWAESALIGGVRGTEMSGSYGGTARGMHGAFTPRDVHNVLLAVGPHFRTGFSDPLPSGNVDVAPTVACLLGVELPGAEGRTLEEALAGGPPLAAYTVRAAGVDAPQVATGLRMRLPTDPNGADVDGSATTYRVHLQTKVLVHGGRTFTYFDLARADRR
jgi:arylsulfatase A-like enzyme